MTDEQIVEPFEYNGGDGGALAETAIYHERIGLGISNINPDSIEMFVPGPVSPILRGYGCSAAAFSYKTTLLPLPFRMVDMLRASGNTIPAAPHGHWGGPLTMQTMLTDRHFVIISENEETVHGC